MRSLKAALICPIIRLSGVRRVDAVYTLGCSKKQRDSLEAARLPSLNKLIVVNPELC